MNVDFLPLLSFRIQARLQADLRAVIAVGTKHHGAVLPVKGEVGDLDAAAAAVQARGLPAHRALERYHNIDVQGNVEISVIVVQQHHIREPNGFSSDAERIDAIMFCGVPA